MTENTETQEKTYTLAELNLNTGDDLFHYGVPTALCGATGCHKISAAYARELRECRECAAIRAYLQRRFGPSPPPEPKAVPKRPWWRPR